MTYIAWGVLIAIALFMLLLFIHELGWRPVLFTLIFATTLGWALTTVLDSLVK